MEEILQYTFSKDKRNKNKLWVYDDLYRLVCTDKHASKYIRTDMQMKLSQLKRMIFRMLKQNDIPINYCSMQAVVEIINSEKIIHSHLLLA
jgi:hypothetical protein